MQQQPYTSEIAMPYTHLLVAVDQSAERPALLAKAQQLAQRFSARLSVVSVLLPVPLSSYAGDIGMPMSLPMSIDPVLSQELALEARQRLLADSTPLGIADADLHIVLGNASSGIVECAEQLGADLVVIGHHPHEGFLSRLFSHTDENVAGRARCDVLAVLLPRSG